MPPSSSGVLLLLDVYLKSNQLLCQTDANFLLMTVGITSGYHMTGYHIQRQSSDNETTAFRGRVCSVCHGLKVSHRVSLCVCVCMFSWSGAEVYKKPLTSMDATLNQIKIMTFMRELQQVRLIFQFVYYLNTRFSPDNGCFHIVVLLSE